MIQENPKWQPIPFDDGLRTLAYPQTFEKLIAKIVSLAAEVFENELSNDTDNL